MSAYECRSCGIKGKTNFYKNAKYQCKKCWNKRTYQSGKSKIDKLKLDRGGKCEKCGYNKYLGALEWHHLDPNVKEYAIGKRRGLKPETLQKEIEKCSLLCANCHAEAHAD